MNKIFINLYRNILREHRIKLPSKLKEIGDEYVKKEFRLHKNTKDSQSEIFMNNWENYLKHIKSQNSKFGIDMNQSTLNSLNSEQLIKLEQLKDETKKVFVPDDKS